MSEGKYGKKSIIAAIKIIIFVALFQILTRAIDSTFDFQVITTPGHSLIFIIAAIITFNKNLRIIFNIQNPINKALILISIFWILSTTTFLVVFSDYGTQDFFGTKAMDAINAILFVPLFIAIGGWLHKIYKNSL
jgi:hypothetical protein